MAIKLKPSTKHLRVGTRGGVDAAIYDCMGEVRARRMSGVEFWHRM